MDFFLATLLSCADGRWILEGIGDVELTSPQRSGLVMEVLQQMPDDCTYEDYNAHNRTGSRRRP